MKYNRIIVGVADMHVSDRPRDQIITFSLGSCLGVSFFDPEIRIGGLIHCMLPTARLNMDKAADTPEVFVDTGLSLILQQLFDHGAARHRLVVKLAGAASVLNDNKFFRVGERNYLCAKKFFARNMIPIAGEDVRGTISRTLSLYITNGVTTVKSFDREIEI